MNGVWLSRLLAVSVFVAGACGSSSEDEAAPLVFEQLGISHLNIGEQIRAREISEARVVEAAGICMKEQGYTWIPWTSSELYAPEVSELERGTPEFAAVYGYGILPLFPTRIRTHPLARQNPNDVFIDGLERSERNVFYQTLYGADVGTPRAAGVEEELYDQGGCIGRANRDFGIFPNLSDALFAQYEDIERRANADEAVVAYDAEWSDCMAEKGFAYESSPSAVNAFSTIDLEIWSATTFPVSEYDSDALRALTDDERRSLYALPPIYDQQRVADEAEREIAVATADFECQGDQPRTAVFGEALAKYEDEFLETNPEVVASLEQEGHWLDGSETGEGG